jgi:hypothetical protein
MRRFITLIFILLLIQLSTQAQSCLPDGITFETQAQIDSFQVNYPGCTEIEGDVTIHNTDINDLSGLSVLTHIGGRLAIQQNNALTSLEGFDNLASVGEYVFIAQNNALTSFTGFDSLKSIGAGFEISFNDALTSLLGLEGLTYINGSITIDENPVLTSLTGLENISAGSISDLHIAENVSLSSCEVHCICDFLESPNGRVDIYDNAIGCNSPPEIASICGITLPCLPYGNYHFSSQVEIDNFQTDYPGCTDLLGYVVINGSDITNLNGLSIVDSIGRSLCVAYNPVLQSLTGLDNIDAGSITGLYIYYNSNLSNCAVQSICDYLTSPNGDTNIFYNAPGCNSVQEVEAACGVGVDESSVVGRQSFVSIYPNPSSNVITVELLSNKLIKNTFLTIYNISGQALSSHLLLERQTVVDVSDLPQGIYFVQVIDDSSVEVEKFVKN